MGNDKVTAGGHGVKQSGHDRVRGVGIRYRVQGGKQGDRHRLGEVERCAGLVEDRIRIAQIRIDVLRGAGLAAVGQGAGVREHDGIVVHVHHPGVGRDRLGDLMGVPCGGDAGPDVQELPNPRLGGEIVDRTAEERPVRASGEQHLGVDLKPRLDGSPVGRVVALAAEHVVVAPGLGGVPGTGDHP